MKKVLYILRHAKAESLASGQEDHDRKLMPRGLEDARHMGEYLSAQTIMPDKILCSTAVRVQQTLTGLQLLQAKCQTLDKMYLASAAELLSFITATPETVHSLMLIGHNPGLHELCLTLAKDGNNALRSRLVAAFPTCALATMMFDGTWRNIRQAQVKLAGFMTPKML